MVDGGTASEQATALAFIDSGKILAIVVNNPGSGYTTIPAITLSGGGGAGGAATATVVNGEVISVNVTSAGGGYSSPPNVSIDPPPPGVGFITYWSNDGTGAAGAEPTTGVSVPVDKGLYAVLLGDTSLANMTPIPPTAFDNPDVNLRVWFDDGSTGSQQLTPDQRIAAVGYAMIADNVPDGAITSAKLDSGAVQSYHIAPGSITATQLARPPLSGSIDASSIALAFCVGSFDVSFSTPFGTAPNITLGLESADQGIGENTAVYVTGKSASGFSGSVTLPPASPVTVSDTSNTPRFNSMATVNGRPAFCYYEFPGTAQFVRAADANGEAWLAPVPAGWGLAGPGVTDSGWYPSLDIVAGNPAFTFWDDGDQGLYYSRAADADGTSWGTQLQQVDAGPAGVSCSLKVVFGRPAVAYIDVGDGTLVYQRATSADGSTWPGTGTTIVSNDIISRCSMEIVNFRPAISYFNLTSLRLEYVRANDVTGLTGWSSPVVIAPVTLMGMSMAIVNGNPAIAYIDGALDEVRYVRATDANGTAWGPSVLLGSSSNMTSSPGPSLVVNNGRPMVSFVESDGGELLVTQATDANGTTWSAPCSIAESAVAPNMAIINGTPAVCFGSGVTTKPEYIRQPSTAFTINWIALEP